MIGCFLAFLFIFLFESNLDLSASVLSLQERSYIEKSSWDAAYKRNIHDLEVFISPQLQKETELFVSIFFSSHLTLDFEHVESPYTVEQIEENAHSVIYKVSWFQTGNVDEWILLIPFSWEKIDITVESISLEKDGNSVSLWCLDNIEVF